MCHQAGVHDFLGALPSSVSVLSVPGDAHTIGNSTEGRISMTDPNQKVYSGVDTHLDVNVAAVIDETGRLLGTRTFPTSPLGLRRLERWIAGHDSVATIGVEGTGTYGLGLHRDLTTAGNQVIEVNRPNGQTRRAKGKSDTVDAEAAARAVLSGHAAAIPKLRNGIVEAIRVLRSTARATRVQMTRLESQVRHLVITAPETIRVDLQGLTDRRRMGRAAAYPPGPDGSDIPTATKTALRTLARQCSPRWPGSARSRHPAARPTDTASTAQETGKPTRPCTASSWSACHTSTQRPWTTWLGAPPNDCPSATSAAA